MVSIASHDMIKSTKSGRLVSNGGGKRCIIFRECKWNGVTYNCNMHRMMSAYIMTRNTAKRVHID